jgi:hypothetical protein
MAKCYDIQWSEEEQRYRSVPENGFGIPSEPAWTEFAVGYAVEPSLRPKPDSLNTTGRWYPKSQTIDMNGYQIEGMVYFGTGLSAVHGHGIEPALINPFSKVYAPNPSYKGQDLPYWPSYESLSPQGRGRYLKWLAEGRKDLQIAIGFVFLFLYGLERRLLADDCPPEEEAELIAEIERLRTLYGANPTFDAYAFRLLDFLKAKELDVLWVEIEEHAAPPVQRAWDPPYGSTLRMGLGQCAECFQKVPPSWALAWAESHPAYRQRTAAERCRPEFVDLFQIKYASQFPNGLRLRRHERKIKIEYHPASASFARSIVVQTQVPDVSLFEDLAAALKGWAMGCAEQLDAYSRYVGRNPEAKGSVPAMALLPEALIRTRTDRVVPDLRSWLEITLQDSFALVTGRDFLERAGIRERALPKKDAVLLAQFLERLNVGLEPDPRFGIAMPAADAPVVLFRLEGERTPVARPGYATASTALSLTVAMNVADRPGKMDHDGIFESHILKTFDLSTGEKLRLRARSLWLLQTGVNLRSLRKPIGILSPEQRESIGRFLLDIAQVAGHISRSEIDRLVLAFRLLRLNPESVFSATHARATEPALVSQPRPMPSRFPIPNPPQSRTSPNVAVDMAKVAALNSESERVSALLQEIFVAEDQPVPSVPTAKENALGLDDPHSQFLARILKNDRWRSADLASVAAECQVLVNGAIDALNNLALDRYGDLLLGGDDPLSLNPMIAKEFKNEYD